MKKKLTTLGISLLPLLASADEVPGLIITKTDNSQLSVALTSIRSIKFQEGTMLILQKDNSTQQISVDEITLLSFENVSTAIQSLMNDKTDGLVIITDLSGKVLFEGQSNSQDIPNDIHGNVILTIDGKSHKINLR